MTGFSIHHFRVKHIIVQEQVLRPERDIQVECSFGIWFDILYGIDDFDNRIANMKRMFVLSNKLFGGY